MKNEYQFSNLVYDFFLMRFRFQYYTNGETLPSIDILCREFSLSAQTVKAALRRLRSEGYIDMHNGRPTKVIFRQTQEEYEEAIFTFFSRRSYAYPDLFRTMEQMLVPLFAEGLKRADENDFMYLAPYIERLGTDDLLYIFSYLLQKLDNPLALNLFWEVSLFMGLLFFNDKEDYTFRRKHILREDIKNIITIRKTQNWKELHEAFLKFQSNTAEQALTHISKHIPPAEEKERIPFTWRIYYGRPQLCYSLGIRLLHEIYVGEYQGKQYLPSYEKMAKKYNVSVSTIRRTINVLNQFGATESVNGVGTYVFFEGECSNLPDFTSTAVRKNLALFFQSFELIIYSCEAVIPSVFSAMSGNKRDKLILHLEENIRLNRCKFTLWHLLLWIAHNSPQKGIQNIYFHIYSLLLWGYPLETSKKETLERIPDAMQFTQSVITCVKERNYRQCIELLKNLLTDMLPAAEDYLLLHGIMPEELRLAPSIRLSLTV